MTKICMYFQVHQPFRLSNFNYFSRGSEYFDDSRNREIFDKVARKCYIPTTRKLIEMVREHPEFKVSFSLSGIFIEQAMKYKPEVIDIYRKLYDTGNMDILNETYYHSLAYLISEEEFREQVKMHRNLINEIFGHKSRVFRNTEAMLSNDMSHKVEKMGYKGIVGEGWDKILGWRSPNYIYQPNGSDIKLLLRNYRLSDDIGFRFSTVDWKEYPLTADKYATWLASTQGQTINLFLDYETFGEHQWKETGIFDFLEYLPREVSKYPHLEWAKISELTEMESKDRVDVPHILSWADIDRDLSAWLGNKMQDCAFRNMKDMGSLILKSGDRNLIDTWRKLQTSDHFYYMCTKWFADGDIHKYFNNYVNPYEAYSNYMNVLNNLKGKLGIGPLKSKAV